MTVTKNVQDLIARLRAVQHGAYNAYAASVAQEAADTLAAISAQPVAVPDGWKMVPVGHTAAMHRAGSDALDAWEDIEKGAPGKLTDVRASMCGAAMLAAAPQPAPQPVAYTDASTVSHLEAGTGGIFPMTTEPKSRHGLDCVIPLYLGPPADLREENERLRQRVKVLEGQIAKGEWYWPADDTSSDMCADGVWGVRDNVDLQPGQILHYATGGVLNYGYYAFLEAAKDADSDDEFEVDAATEEEVRVAIDAELARRAALKGGEE